MDRRNRKGNMMCFGFRMPLKGKDFPTVVLSVGIVVIMLNIGYWKERESQRRLVFSTGSTMPGNVSRNFSQVEEDLSEPPHTRPEVTTSTHSRIPTTAPKKLTKDEIIQKYLEDEKNLCLEDWRSKVDITGKRPLCDCVPKTLLGPLHVDFKSRTTPHNPNVLPGGHWEPADCIPRYKIVVIVPFRDRESHLSVLLRYLHPVLQGQQANYTIMVIEQDKPALFNKAAIMNVGYHYAMKEPNVDCVIFHDVDFIPEDGRHFYRCKHSPLHLGAFYDRKRYKLQYLDIFGAATAFRPVDFEKVNGFSNHYFGWGGEDDDMSRRVRENFPAILRDPREVAGYKTIAHPRDKGNRQPNMKAMWAYLDKKYHASQDGLNTLKFIFKKRILHPLYTWILVDILKE